MFLPPTLSAMRLARALAAFALAAGCRESPTSPFREVSTPAPSGLGVSITYAAAARDTAAGVPSIGAAGDSLVVVARLAGGWCGFTLAASAGTVDGAVVVTSVVTPDPTQLCLAIAYAQGPVVRAVVRPAPRGRYAVVARERLRRSVGSTLFDERVLVSRVVTLR